MSGIRRRFPSMPFDPSTLCARTAAGDAELAAPRHGLAIAQRRLLSLLDHPVPLDELAGRPGVHPERLEKDLARLAEAGLVELHGTHPDTASRPAARPAPPPVPAPRQEGPRPWTEAQPGLAATMTPPPPEARIVQSRRIRRGRALVIGFLTLVALGAVAWWFGAPHGAVLPAPAVPPPVPVAPAPAAAHRAEAPAPAILAPPARIAALPESFVTEPSSSAGSGPAATRPAPPEPAATVLPSRPAPVPAPAIVRPAERPPLAAAPEVPAPAAPRPELRQPGAPPSTVSTPAAPTAAESSAASPSPAVAPPQGALAPPPAVPPPPPAAVPASPPAADVVAAAPVALPPVRPPAAAVPAAPSRLEPLTRETPEFPRDALANGIDRGTVRARLAIDAAGKVTGVEILDAQPRRVFDRAVMRSLARWTYPPGEPARATVVEIAFKRE